MATFLPGQSAHPFDSSAAIKAARVLCIVSMVYVHGWFGVGVSQLPYFGWQSGLVFLLVDLVGRSSVPLLSIISGWLLVASAAGRPAVALVAGKARSLLVPMLLWNAIGLAAAALVVSLGGLSRFADLFTLPEMLNEITAWEGRGRISVQTVFLRDLFISMGLALVLLRLPPALTWVVIALFLGCQLAGIAPLIVHRAQIPAFLLIGTLIGRRGAVPAPAAGPLLVAGLVLMVAAIARYRMPGQEGTGSFPFELADLLLRFSISWLVWCAAVAVSRSALMPAFARLEPGMFFLFGSHALVLMLLGPVVGRVTGPIGSALWPAFFLMQPFVALAVAIVGQRGLVRISPLLTDLLSGGRVAGERSGRAEAAVAGGG